MSLKRVNGVYFDGKHSYYDFGLWLSKRPDLGSPSPKTNTIEVPGADGIIDMTEANAGEVKFTNRTIVLSFVAMAEIKDQAEFKMRIMTALHGKTISQIVFDEDSDWCYSGRATVAFSKLEPWRLGCTITIDAAPYAMRLHDTTVDLVPDVVTLQEIELPGVDTTPYPYDTRLMFGSYAFPSLNLMEYPGFGFIYLRWPDDSPRRNYNRFYQVASPSGNYTSSGWSQQIVDSGEFSIDRTMLAQQGVDLTNIFSITVIGVGGVKAFVQMVAKKITVWNERKQVVPMFDLVMENQGTEYQGSAQIYINGTYYEVQSGSTQDENIILKSGLNEIMVPLEPDIKTFTMTFREGKL